MNPEKRLYLVWQGDDTADYERIEDEAGKMGLNVNDYVKSVLKKAASEP